MRALKGSRVAAAKLHSINGGTLDQSYGYFPYINIFKGRYNDFNSTAGGGGFTFDANSDIASINVGVSVFCTIWGPLVNGQNYIPAGTYILKWTGSDLPVTITCVGSSALTKLSANRWSMVIPQISASNSLTFSINWNNNTGSSAVTLTNIRLCLSGHEAAMDGGQISHPDWLTFVNHPQSFRPMKNYCVEFSTASVAADCRQESWNTWGVYTGGGTAATTGLPATAAAKMAVEMGSNLWAICPGQMVSQSEMNTYAASFWSVAAFQSSSLLIYTEYSNENWNFSYPQFNFLNSTWGPTQTSATYPSGLTAPLAEAKLALMWAKAFLNAGVPRNRLRITISLQAAGFGAYATSCMGYIDESNILGSGGTQVARDLIDQIAIAPYDIPCDPSGTALFNGVLYNIDWAAQTDGQIDAFYAKGLLVANPGMQQFITWRNANRPAIRLSTYEWGNGLNSSNNFGLVGTSYEATINVANNTLMWTQVFANATPLYNDGDAVVFIAGATGAKFTGSITTAVLTVSAVASGTLSIGQTVEAATQAGGYYAIITSLGTGAGGTGTYNLSASTTVGSSSMTSGNTGSFFGNFPYSTYPGNLAEVIIKQKNANEAWVFANDAARLADVGNTGAGAITLDGTSGTTTTFWMGNATRARALSARIFTYLDSTAGATMYANIVSSQIGPTLLQEATQLYEVAGYSSYPLGAYAWGVKRAVHAADTPRSTYFMSI